MEICKAEDPIKRLKLQMDPERAEALEKEAMQAVEEAVLFAQQSPEPDVDDLKKYMFTEEGLSHAL